MNEALLTSLREKKVGYHDINNPDKILPFRNPNGLRCIVYASTMYYSKGRIKHTFSDFLKPISDGGAV